MKSWSETVHFSQPLRGLRLVNPGLATEGHAPSQEEQLHARYERGHLDGQNALREQLLQQRTETQELVNGVVAALRQVVPQVVRDSEQALVMLALEIAQKLVADLPVTVPMIEAMVREALSHVDGSTEIHVRLHHEDLELLRKVNSTLLADSAESKGIFFHSSPEVTRGGCLVQTRFGVFDATRETKFDLLKRTLLK